MALSQTEMDEAAALLGDTSKSEQERTRDFYAYLDSKGEYYGRLGLGVTDNDTWQGQVANGFAASGDDNNTADVSYGSDDWTALNLALAERHLQAYQANNGGEPQWNQIQQYHNEEYVFADLDVDDWFPNKMLNESGDPSALWDDWMSNDGFVDIILDAVDVVAAGGALLIPPFFTYEALTDPSGLADSMEFAKNLYEALNNLDNTGRRDLLEDLFGEEAGGKIADAIEQAEGLSDDYGWPWNIPGAVYDEFLRPPPSWMQDLLDDIGDAEDVVSPLVLDLDGDGIELTTMGGTGSVYWDIDLDGMAEASGWITGGDGLLAVDLNADGIINDHSELFGDQTGSANGFEALTVYDSNSDGYITSADAQFGDLLVWVDVTADGYSQADELHTLNELNITSIDLGYSNVSYSINGNDILQESTFTINGQTRDIVDAWFTYDDVNTVYAGDYTLDVRTLFLPTLRGYGNLPDLHIAMSLDETLLNMVVDIVASDLETLFSSPLNFKGVFEAVLYRWAGVDAVNPASRGTYIDARKLEFIEELTGAEWTRSDSNPNPTLYAAELLEGAFESALANFTSQILVQTSFNYLVPDNATYNAVTGEIEGAEAIDIFRDIEDENIDAMDGTSDMYFYTPLSGTSRLDDHGGSDQIWFDSSISLDDIRFWQTASEQLLLYYGSEYILIEDQFSGNSDYQIELARFGDGTVVDLTKDLWFSGTSSADDVYGLINSDDTLDGGAGSERLYGYTGNDTYIYDEGYGNDQIYEDGGVDKIILGINTDISEIRFWKSSNDLLLYVNSEQLRIKSQFLSINDQVETAHLSDGTIIDLTQDITFTGTSGANSVYALSDSNDTLDGGLGNDSLYGYTGDDTYIYDEGYGNDKIYEDGGNDKILLGQNTSVSEVRFFISGDDLLLYVNSEQLRIKNQFTSVDDRVEVAQFQDGTVIDLTQDMTFTGTASRNTVKALENSDDILYGLEGTDYLYGYSGNDILNGGQGADRLYGGSGDDIFAILAGDLGTGQDLIYDFAVSDDKLDISDILDVSDWDGTLTALSDYVTVTNQSGYTYVAIDLDGVGTNNNFVNAARLNVSNVWTSASDMAGNDLNDSTGSLII